MREGTRSIAIGDRRLSWAFVITLESAGR